MQHVKDQNWLAVGLDVCVVVVGIFLGMQVTNWTQERNETALEQQYLQRLNEDLKENVAELSSLAEFHGKIRNNINEVASFLMQEEWNPDTHATLTKRVTPWNAVPSAALQMGAWEELLSTGRLALIKDRQLRELLQKVAASQTQSNGTIDYIRQGGGYLEEHMNEISYLFRAESGEMFIRFTFEPVFQDEKFVTLMLFQASIQARLQNLRANQAKTNEVALSHLQCLLEKPECPQN